MASTKQIQANRLNALQSTGPTTKEGKAIVSQNALRHGLVAKHVLVRGEKAKDFEDFRTNLVVDLNPATAIEELLADRIAILAWKLRRIVRVEAAILNEPAYMEREFPRNFASRSGTLQLATRYEASTEKLLHKNLHELQRIQAMRLGVRDAVPKALDVTIDA